MSHYGDYILKEGCNILYQECIDDCFEAYYSLGYFDENGKYVNNISGAAENWGSGKLCEGYSIGEHYIHQLYRGTGAGYTGGWPDLNAGPVDGMIRTQQDMEWLQAMIDAGYSFNGVKTLSPDTLWYGDFIYADANGDKNYGNEDDKNFNGHSSSPSYNVGINLGFSYKGLDFSMQWAGAFDYYIYWSSSYYNDTTIAWGYAISERIANDHYFYDPKNPDDPRTNINATYPRFVKGDARNKAASDFYEYKGDFMKLKKKKIFFYLWMSLKK